MKPRTKTSGLTRRQFVATTATVGAALSGGQRLLSRANRPGAPQDPGRKGKVYPDQRRRFTDPRSGYTIWQLTNAGAHSTKLYFTNRSVTPDSRWLLYHSDRGSAPGHFNLFKMDLRTGESIQLTESGAVTEDTPEISYDGKQVYYGQNFNSVHAVDLESLNERTLCAFDDQFHTDHAFTITPDGRSLIVTARLEPIKKLGYNFGHYTTRAALTIVDTATGATRRLIDGSSPLGHTAICPTNGNLVLYSIHIHWAEIQRPWLINLDGTEHRLIFRQTQGEGIGHELWGASGRTVFVSCYGGRQPEGLWAANVDGTNERCVLSGTNIGHGCVNPEEDRFIVDELFTDTTSLWLAKKGSNEPQLLHKMSADWFTPQNGVLQPTPFHPHPRFLPNGTGVVFNSGGEIYLLEM
jgi:Tol biopolymer transport system component